MNRVLAVIGIVLTSVYLYFIWQLIGDSYFRLETMPLNEVGDFLAGVFGPVAIFWLVLGFFQQGMELRQNNEALRLQASELKNSVEQQRELVAVTREQVSAEISQMQAERDRRLASLEPIFAFKTIYGHLSNGIYFFSCDVKNAGNKVTDLSINIDSIHFKLLQGEFPSLLHGDVFKLGLHLDSLDNFFGFTMQFYYKDAEGGYRMQSCALAPLPEKPGRSPGLERIDAC